MDEILIEDKKYVSSKQAAKMTGYAKDYIGQLCREGRVPARLIGRSWYVLETAIQDHRFGADQKESGREDTSAPVLPQTWESPRYEAASSEFLPSAGRSQDNSAESAPENREIDGQHLQDSWKAWFDQVGDITQKVEVAPEPEKEDEEPQEPEASTNDGEVNIPIRTVYQAPPEELLPPRRPLLPEVEPIESISYTEEQAPRMGYTKGAVRTIQAVGAVLALVAATTAVIGSGYLDEYIISSDQAQFIAGVVLYNK